jgi:hypothetical protein
LEKKCKLEWKKKNTACSKNKKKNYRFFFSKITTLFPSFIFPTCVPRRRVTAERTDKTEREKVIMNEKVHCCVPVAQEQPPAVVLVRAPVVMICIPALIS